MINPYIFEVPLLEGLIIKRRNRFIMEVEINNVIYDCHCPTTGRIGNIVFDRIPCLLSKSNNEKRKTLYTVEAISLDLPSEENKSWIGINQTAANRYVEHYLRNSGFKKMVCSDGEVKREQVLGDSKLDFLIGNTYLEVKTPLLELQIPIKPHIKTKKVSEFQSFERFIKHINELSNSLKKSERAILLTCFLYDNKMYTVSKNGKHSQYISENVQNTIHNGMEIWQANFKINPEKVDLINFFETTSNFLKEGVAIRNDV